MNKPKYSKRASKHQEPRVTSTLRPEEFPEIYAMVCDGHCLAPEIVDGTTLVFSRDDVCLPGDTVMVHLKPEFVQPGQHQFLVKKLVLGLPKRFWNDPDYVHKGNIAPVVIVEMLNPRKMIYIDPNKMAGMHKCLGPLRPDQQSYTVEEDDVRAAASLALVNGGAA